MIRWKLLSSDKDLLTRSITVTFKKQESEQMKLPLGFRYAGTACGIKASGKEDLAIITTDAPAICAGVYTQNIVRALSLIHI